MLVYCCSLNIHLRNLLEAQHLFWAESAREDAINMQIFFTHSIQSNGRTNPMKYILTILFILLSTNCYSAQSGWVDNNGNMLQNTESKKSIQGFGGWLLITSDQDWQEKWDTPESTTPHFTETGMVKRGEKISILPLFTNAVTDENDHLHLTCDIRIINSENEVTFNQKDIDCFNDVIKGDPRSVRLAYTVIDIIADENEPAGKWTVYFDFVNQNRNIRVPLKSEFYILD